MHVAYVAVVAALVAAFLYMLVHVVTTNIALHKHASERLELDARIRAQVANAIEGVKGFNMLRAFTIVLDVYATHKLNDASTESSRAEISMREALVQNRIAADNVDGFGLYANVAGSLKPMSSVASGIKLSAIEFLAFRRGERLSPSTALYQEYYSGTVRHVVIQNRTFLALRWHGGETIESMLDTDAPDPSYLRDAARALFVIPLVPLSIDSFELRSGSSAAGIEINRGMFETSSSLTQLLSGSSGMPRASQTVTDELGEQVTKTDIVALLSVIAY